MHYSAYVILDAPSVDEVERRLEPFNENSPNRKEGKWDWYQIGGRWTGHFDGYDPTKDPANLKTCSLCAGTGRRDDALGRQARITDPNYSCNGCNGTGKEVSWPTQFGQRSEDFAPVSIAIEKKPAYVVLTPDGVWHAREEYHPEGEPWFRPSVPDWPAEVRRLLGSYPNSYVAIVDIHS